MESATREREVMHRKLIIREAKASEIATLSELAIQTYTDAFGHSFIEADLSAHLEKYLSPNNFAHWIKEDGVLVAQRADRLVGYVHFGPVKSALGTVALACIDPADRALRRLYIQREFQNAGYGGALMEAALGYPSMKDAPNIYLEVWEHNLGAQRFYRRHGFEVIGKTTFLKASGVSDSLELVMVRHSLPEAESSQTTE